MEEDVSGDFTADKNLLLQKACLNHAYNAVIDKYGGNYFSYM